MAENTPLVVVYPRGQLTAEDKATMRDVGIIAVEADDPKAVQQLHLMPPMVNTRINGDGIVQAAVKAMASLPGWDDYDKALSGAKASYRFVKFLNEAMEADDAQQ